MTALQQNPRADEGTWGASFARRVRLRAWKLAGILVVTATLSGCGGCQPGSMPEEGDESSQKKATPAAAAQATRPAIVPPAALPPARELPTMNVERPGGMQPEAAGEEPAAEEEPEEADCSVIADADPDYGEPPLTVQFSVDYECTESGATVNWDFGDGGTTAGEENPSHAYREAGEFVAVVTVTTPDGATATDEIDITVESEEEPPPDVEPENP